MNSCQNYPLDTTNNREKIENNCIVCSHLQPCSDNKHGYCDRGTFRKLCEEGQLEILKLSIFCVDLGAMYKSPKFYENLRIHSGKDSPEQSFENPVCPKIC